MPKALIINYGIGNLFSIKCSLERAGFSTNICSDASQELEEADAIILPGVGNFKAGAENLLGIRDRLVELILGGRPVLGICLGMQLFFEESEESPGRGLSILSGKVVRLPPNVRVPHMGWNNLEVLSPSEILEGISTADYFYFAHSYYAIPQKRNVISAETMYGVKFASVIVEKNIFGVQFHPEKSGRPGERIIENFMRIVKR
ncbi:imidazole glycerol phosphate synthase subunit HisH [Candidatus Bathyarchaeota archaeon]|nr:imidazole glycerol phosphate synthase subunit HisH [Candidatus Bathyarchaeota archaeon]